MRSRTIGLSRRRAERAPVAEPAAPLPYCTPEAVANVLRVLLGQPVRPAQVVVRAVGLGLLRQPAAGEPPRLPAQAVARLFLAGYGVPAAVEAGTLRSLHDHVRAGRITFILLAAPEGGAADDFEMIRVIEGPAEGGLLVTPPGGAARPAVPEEIAEPWAAAGHFLIAGLRSWSELPMSGQTFFGGSRDRDGSYHWYTAECDTDAAGRILRY